MKPVQRFRHFAFVAVVILTMSVFSGVACSPEHAVNPTGTRQQDESCTRAADCAEGLVCAGGYCVGVDTDAGVLDGAGFDLLHADMGVADQSSSELDAGPVDQLVDDSANNDAANSDAASPGDAALIEDSTVLADVSLQNDATLADAAMTDSASADTSTQNCLLVLSPADISLGEVAVGSSQSFSLVAQAQQGSCQIDSVIQSPANSALTLVEPQTWPQQLQAGEQMLLRYVYSPLNEESLNTQIQVQVAELADDVMATVVATALQQDDGNCLHFVQSAIDFGQLPLGCTTESAVILRNDCWTQRKVDITDIAGDAAFSLGAATSFTINGRSSRVVPVQVLATTVGVKAALLSALLDTGEPVGGVVTLLADVVDNGTVSDFFIQGGDKPVDLVIVVDDSGSTLDGRNSMQAAQARLATDITALTDAWSNQNVDFHIGVTTTDMTEDLPVVGGGGPRGRFMPLDENDPVLSPLTDNLAVRLQQAVQPGTDGDSLNESGLDAVHAALSPQLLSGRNKDFLRSQAQLALLFLSDEDDHSDISVDALLASLRDLKTVLGANALSAAAIVGPQPNGCDNGDLAADVGTRYLQLVERMSGRSMSLCDPDWGVDLGKFAEQAAGRRATFFARNDVNAQPEVYVDGQLMARNQDYQWLARRNAIVFVEASVPQMGQEIELRYVPVCQ